VSGRSDLNLSALTLTYLRQRVRGRVCALRDNGSPNPQFFDSAAIFKNTPFFVFLFFLKQHRRRTITFPISFLAISVREPFDIDFMKGQPHLFSVFQFLSYRVHIPQQTGHRFHGKPATQSSANRPLIPRQTGQSEAV
jgi:hypothetical protein